MGAVHGAHDFLQLRVELRRMQLNLNSSTSATRKLSKRTPLAATSLCVVVIHIWSRSTATMEGSARGESQPTLSTSPVGGDQSTRRKPTTFQKALTDSFHECRAVSNDNPQPTTIRNPPRTESHITGLKQQIHLLALFIPDNFLLPFVV